jgi:hypothetical protein
MARSITQPGAYTNAAHNDHKSAMQPVCAFQAAQCIVLAEPLLMQLQKSVLIATHHSKSKPYQSTMQRYILQFLDHMHSFNSITISHSTFLTA